MSDYPSSLTLRPIVAWPGKPRAVRERSRFSAPWNATLRLLDRELFELGKGGRSAVAVLQIAMREQDFRQDGMPRANSRPEHPGVILSVTDSIKGPLSFPCDKYDRWQDNLRAIALSLEGLRAIDRHGVTQNAEQYVGWKAIGSGVATTTPIYLTPIEAAEYLQELYARIGGQPTTNLDKVRRVVVFNHHPDTGGSRDVWDRIEAAVRVLRAAGRL